MTYVQIGPARQQPVSAVLADVWDEVVLPLHPTNWHHGQVVATQKIELTLAGLRRVKGELVAVASRRGATNLRVFGSVARDQAGPSSDIDLLVDLEPGRSLVDLGGLLMDLTELLGVDVDVVTEASLKSRVRTRVLEEAVPL